MRLDWQSHLGHHLQNGADVGNQLVVNSQLGSHSHVQLLESLEANRLFGLELIDLLFVYSNIVLNQN